MTRMRTLYGLLGSRFHAKRADAVAGRLVPQHLDKSLDCRPPTTRLDHQEIVLLRRDRQKTETVEIGDWRDSDAPIGAALGDRSGHGVVRARLIGVTGRLGAAQKAIDKH